MTGQKVDLNCDLGESFGRWSLGADQDVVTSISSASVACGFHGGDWSVIDRTVGMCAAAGVSIGAHPSYPDRQGFGRRSVAMEPKEIEQLIIYQVGAVSAFCQAHDVPLRFVKPHGALYNDAASNPAVAWAIAHGIRRLDSKLALVGLAGSKPFMEAAADAGLRFVGEGFADRLYMTGGALSPRSTPGSVISESHLVVEQAVALAHGDAVRTSDGEEIFVRAETICLHGDSPGVADLARAIREGLLLSEIHVRPFA